ncbi:hypothetical protein ACFY1B_04750 [Streptomyces mirabilis]|uniref:hypothetical protein n=1 Tax=Streptomyces mirabilis TaxID=68239 RepID=UPI0036CB2668
MVDGERAGHLRGTAAAHRPLPGIAATAAFLASDHAGGITGTFVNVTGGMFPG